MNRPTTDSAFPSVDESANRLHRAGWSIGEAGTSAGWRVCGTNGENTIDVTAASQAEAWWRACEEARALGTLALSCEASSRIHRYFS